MNELVPIERRELVAGDLAELASRAIDYADAAMSPNTRRAYDAAWRAFRSWCQAHYLLELPAAADTVALYLTARAVDLKVNTLELHRAAIDAAHRACDFQVPDSARLREVWTGIRKERGAPPRPKKALRLPELKKALRAIPRDLAGARDRALLLLGYASAMRRSEICQLSLDETAVVRCTFVDEGVVITIGRSKGDQLGKGATVAIPTGKHPATCPVKALRAWLQAAKIESGAVFRPVDRFGRVGREAIGDKTFVRAIKTALERVGLDAGIYAGHSLRRGSISDAVKAGASTEAVQAHARHARWDTTRGYIEEAERFDNSAAGKLGL